jgi:hypothetical protein
MMHHVLYYFAMLSIGKNIAVCVIASRPACTSEQDPNLQDLWVQDSGHF